MKTRSHVHAAHALFLVVGGCGPERPWRAAQETAGELEALAWGVVGSPIPGGAQVIVDGESTEARSVLQVSRRGHVVQLRWAAPVEPSTPRAAWDLEVDVAVASWEAAANGRAIPLDGVAAVGRLAVRGEGHRYLLGGSVVRGAGGGGSVEVRVESPLRAEAPAAGVALPGAGLPRWTTADVGDVIVVRPTEGALRGGLTTWALDSVAREVLTGRGPYDFMVVVESQGLPSEIRGTSLASFTLIYDEVVTGVGQRRPSFTGREGDVRGILWMNTAATWSIGDPLTDWVFAQELGHTWLAWVQVDLGEGPVDVLRGRDRAHWSYFLDTGTSPMEGNRWIDHGDGTFTSDPAAGLGRFSDLDLYLMGLRAPGEVAPFFLIDPDATEEAEASWPPEAVHGRPPRTVRGTRVDVAVGDVIAVEGLVAPGPEAVDRELSIATVLVVGPAEHVTTAAVAEVAALQEAWVAAWDWATHGESAVSFALLEEGQRVTPRPPVLVPDAAR